MKNKVKITLKKPEKKLKITLKKPKPTFNRKKYA